MGKRLVHFAEGCKRVVHVFFLNRGKMSSSAEDQQVFQVAVGSGAAGPGRRGRKRKRRQPRRHRDADQPLGADIEEPPSSAEASAAAGGTGGTVGAAGGETEKVLHIEATDPAAATAVAGARTGDGASVRY